MSLKPLQIRYLFDPTGESKSNLVERETHTLPPKNKRIISAREGSFFAKSLIVRKKDGEVLEKGKDYELAGYYQDGSIATGQDVNTLIYFSNPAIIGDIEITYQVVGGVYTGTFENIQEYINTLLVDPRKPYWDDILAKPELYAPKEHFHDINDVYGLNYLVPKFEEIRQVLLQVRSKSNRKLYDRMLQISANCDKLIREANKVIAGGLNDIRSFSGDVAGLRTRIAGLEQDILNLSSAGGPSGTVAQTHSIQDLLAKLQKVEADIAAIVTRQKEIVALNQSYTALTNKFNDNFNSDKLKPERLPIDPKDNNTLRVSEQGLYSLKETYPVSQNNFLSNRQLIYVDSQQGDDNANDGSIHLPFRTLLKALTSRESGVYTEILLQPRLEYVLPANDEVNLTNGSVLIAGWGNIDDDTKPVIKFTDGTPYAGDATPTYNCIRLYDCALIFDDVKLKINGRFEAIKDRAHYWEYSAIAGGEYFNNHYNTIIFNEGARLDLGEDEQLSLLDTPVTGITRVVFKRAAIEKPFSGAGKLFTRLDNSVIFQVLIGNTPRPPSGYGTLIENTGDTLRYLPKNVIEVYTPNEVALTNLKTHVPQLTRTATGVTSNLITNIDYQSLPWGDKTPTIDELSTQLTELINVDLPELERRVKEKVTETNDARYATRDEVEELKRLIKALTTRRP